MKAHMPERVEDPALLTSAHEASSWDIMEQWGSALKEAGVEGHLPGPFR